MPNFIAFAIPVFFAAIAVEVVVARRKKRAVYRFTDAISDLSAGITQQTLLVFQKGALIFSYVWIYEHHRLFTLSTSSAMVWVAALVLVDFVYYWWHRLSHEVNFLWAAHVVHHSSEDYNLAVALRQGIFTPWTGIPLHLPLALLGFPPVVIGAADSINTLYQFWIHTELVGKLGWLEKVINTPSHHRVHHGINPRYLDRNYGGILIIWDALFGTLEPEGEPVVYGLVKPLDSYNPLWVQLHRWVELVRISAASKHPLDRVRVWFASPRWLPRDLKPFGEAPVVSPSSFRKYDPSEPGGLQLYVALQLLSIVVVVTTLMFNEDSVRLVPGLVTAGLVLATVTAWGGLAEGKPWAVRLEVLRLIAVAMALTVFVAPMVPALPSFVVGGAAVAGAGSMAWWVARYRPGVPAAAQQAA